MAERQRKEDEAEYRPDEVHCTDVLKPRAQAIPVDLRAVCLGIQPDVADLTDALEKWLETLPQTIRDGSIYFTRDGLITTIKEPDTKEHFVSLKMRFKVIEENF